MARRECMPLRSTLARMFPRSELRRLARSTGMCRRRRKVDPFAFFAVLLLTMDGTRHRSLADLRRSFEKVTGVRLTPSSFYGHFTPALTRFLRAILARVLETTAGGDEGTRVALGSIREVLCVDSTVIRLHEALAKVFPACRTNHTKAAAKLHTVLNVRGCGPTRVKITGERVHDGPVLRAGRWVRGRLLLFDLGYFRYQLFDAIGRQGGFYLTRLKENANPQILTLHRSHRARAVEVEGRGLAEIKRDLRGEVLDAEAQVHFRRRPYLCLRSGASLRVRIVGLRDTERGTHHWYITNLPPEVVAAEAIGRLYAARWMVELLFREMKSCYHFESMPSRKAHIVEGFLYLGVITVVTSRSLLAAVRRWGRLGDRRIPLERWARLFASAAQSVLATVLDPIRQGRLRERRLLQFLVAEAPDPNVGRALLLYRAGLACAR